MLLRFFFFAQSSDGKFVEIISEKMTWAFFGRHFDDLWTSTFQCLNYNVSILRASFQNEALGAVTSESLTYRE
jgi:hypothetical protein